MSGAIDHLLNVLNIALKANQEPAPKRKVRRDFSFGEAPKRVATTGKDPSCCLANRGGGGGETK